MKPMLFLGFSLALASGIYCQISTMDINVIYVTKLENIKLICNVPPSTNLTRWTYISGSTGTSLMSYQNGRCTVSPSDSFLSNNTYSYSCTSEQYQVIIHPSVAGSWHNHVLACRDAIQLNSTGMIWIIKIFEGNPCTDCESVLKFDIQEVTEGDNVTFICKVSSNVTYVNWYRNKGSKISAMSGQNGQCSTQGTTYLDNTSKYIYTCNRTVYQVTRLNVQRSEHNDMYMCAPLGQTEGTGSNWIIKVKAQVTAVMISPSKWLVTVKENTQVELNCTTSTARPAASIYWFRHQNGGDSNETRIRDNITTTTDHNDFSVTTSILRFVPTRQDNDTKIFCRAKNSVNTIPVLSNKKKLLNVLYPPSALYFVYDNQSGQNISNKVIDVIEGDTFNIVCKSIDGNPAPTIKWNGQGNTVSVLTVVNIKESETGATCTATNNMNETNQDVVQGRISDRIRFNILIRPVIKGCEFHYNNRPTNVIISSNDNIYTLMVIENETFTLNCSTEGKPTPIVWWKIPQVTFGPSSSVTVKNLTREMNGEYVFTANRLLEPSFKDKQNVTVNMTVSVQVLYPPVVQPMNNTAKLNASKLNVMCNYTAGLPDKTTIKWTRDIDNTEWNGEILNIESLNKTDTGVYTCSASNIMIQSGDSTSYIGQHNQSFYLDVQYAASIKSFSINTFTSKNVTINESDPVILKCTAESNPTALLTLSRESKTLKNVTSNNIEYNIAEAKCLDVGAYFCLAKNKHNGANRVQNIVQLFVNCYPRKAEEINGNIRSEKNTTVKIGFNVIAYPPPNFTWYQLVGDTWTRLHDGDNYNIESANLMSTLTIQNVDIEEFTSFKVIAENDFGDIEQIYTLSPYDKPDPPTRLRHIEGLTTISSIHIEWKPGFNNGPSQTFYIKYKKSSDTVWNYRNVNDNGEETMTITLTGLLENTQYDVIIFASNVKGNSTESDVLTTRTKVTPILSSTPGALIGGIAGGVTGCIVIGIVIIFIIRRYPLFKGNGADRQDIRRSDSDDSDDEDDLVDNPMYSSSSNVAPVASTSASTSSDISSKPVKPNKTNAAGNGDIYSVVNKTKGQGKCGTGKSTNGKDKQKEGDVYENFELDNDLRKKDVGKQLPPEPPPTASKSKIVNQDGLNYADLVFKDKPPGEKMVIFGDDPTPYDLVDFTKKAEPLPDSDEEEQK